MDYQFKMWSWFHYLYILSPFIIMAALWLILRKRSEKTKYIVGVVIGCLSLAILLMRNIEIYVTVGFHPEIIPLQICHFGNIAVFIALVFKNKTAGAMAWCLNMICAFSSLIVADSLAGYPTFFMMRAQAYFWGHLFIVLGALYAVLFKIVRIDKKSFLLAIGCTAVLLVPAMILNAYFINVMAATPPINYFYIFNYHGSPFEALYNLGTMYYYGWFSINYVYAAIIITIGIVGMTGFYYLQKLLQKFLFKPQKETNGP